MPTIAEQVKEQWEANTNKKVTLYSIVSKFDHIMVTGLGTKTFGFKADGSVLKVSGRGRHYRVEVVRKAVPPEAA